MAGKALKAVREAGVLRARDLAVHGVPREYLRRLQSQGFLVRESRGLYRVHGAPVTEHHSLATVCKKVQHGVVCLLSALRFHELTTQAPFEVWLAIDRKARRPKADGVPLRLVRFSGPALRQGIEEHAIEGVVVRVYSSAKTVADCFKYRNKIGLDVAIEALRDYRKRHRAGMDELWRYAKVCRVAAVMQPYLDALA
jgi:predicted transcriptional regulator of viral defense system